MTRQNLGGFENNTSNSVFQMYVLFCMFLLYCCLCGVINDDDDRCLKDDLFETMVCYSKLSYISKVWSKR